MATSSMIVGLDIDGVLGDQVPHLLRRLRDKNIVRVQHRKKHIRSWAEPLGDTDFLSEITTALKEDPEWIKTMPLVAGARAGVQHLVQLGARIIIVTGRPPEADPATKEWLTSKNIPFHDYINTSARGKKDLFVGFLIDDRPENLIDFVNSTEGIGVLLTQPWNKAFLPKERTHEARIRRVGSWTDVPTLIKTRAPGTITSD